MEERFKMSPEEEVIMVARNNINVNGDWRLDGVYNDFYEAITGEFRAKIEEPKDAMERLLIGIGDMGSGIISDGHVYNDFCQRASKFVLNWKDYCFFRFDRKLIVSEMPKKITMQSVIGQRNYEKKETIFFVYEKNSFLSNDNFTKNQILEIIEKNKILEKPLKEAINLEIKQKLLGDWEYIDYILESELDKFPNYTKNNNHVGAFYLFERLNFLENGKVEIMKDDVKFEKRNGEILDVNNTKKDYDDEGILVNYHDKNKKLPITLKEINNQQYLFMPNNSCVWDGFDLDQEFFVYRKIIKK